MGCYYTLCHNTYAYSLLFYKVYIKRENADSWDSGLEKEQILETYSAQLQKSSNFMEDVFRIYKKYWAQEVHQGGHTLPTRVGAPYPPGRSPYLVAPLVALRCPSSAIWCLALEKISRKLSGRSAAISRRNLGRTNLGLQRSCSAGETSLREREIVTIVICWGT